jgi:cell division protease FtsH
VKRVLKNLSFSLILFILLLMILSDVWKEQNIAEWSYSDFVTNIAQGQVKEVTILGNQIEGQWSDGIARRKFTTYAPDDRELVSRLLEKNIKVVAKPLQDNPWWFSLLVNWFPLLLIIGFWIYMLRSMQAGGGKAMSFGKIKTKPSDPGNNHVTFADVAGVDEAKEELSEIIDFLKSPKKFTRLGAKIPRGVLLIGPPGTGKTLLAKAIAGEAEVPFFSISGSDFVEMFVGVGASRVRDLFEQARKSAPCIIFIDEIDAVGRQRGSGLGGGHDEREQTLNQLLVEMDGFDSTVGIILVAATNRPDILDPALLRPGRFDRRVAVHLPDIKGREGILSVHARSIPMDEDVNLKTIAKATPGFSGADLANLINEAALLAARVDKESVGNTDFESARDKIIMGPERKSRVISDKEKRVTAYHEAGHALLALLLPNCDPLHKVTIIPRGMAGGITWTLPQEDKHFYYKSELIDTITEMFGGRAAEELIFSEISSGASNDIKVASKMVRKMICEWGMSERIGPIAMGNNEEYVFLGKDLGHDVNYSQATALDIDREVRRIIDFCHNQSRNILSEKRELLIVLAEALLEKELLSGEELVEILREKGFDIENYNFSKNNITSDADPALVDPPTDDSPGEDSINTENAEITENNVSDETVSYSVDDAPDSNSDPSERG